MSADREQKARDAVMLEPYLWDDARGVCAIGHDGVDRQAIQLLHGPASFAFRERCGRMLVAALNQEVRRESLRLADIQKKEKRRVR